jgi:agmatine/peptidylarginine deiminase
VKVARGIPGAALAAAAGLLLPSPGLAERDVDGLEELLPHAESPLDLERFLAREEPPPAPLLRADPPPLEPIRNCAEWEPLTGVLIRYPLGLPYALLRDLDDFLTLHVVVSSASFGTARTSFAANGVDTSRVEWLVEPNNSIWTRDYGPWFVFDGDGSIAIVDHVYNRPLRPDDDLIPVKFGVQQGIPVHRHDMWHTGGNYMTDGAGVSMSTDLVYDEAASANGMTPAEVDQLMQEYYGIGDYEVVDDIEAGGIHHIDTWGKFLDEETVLVKQVWMAHATYAALEQRAVLLASLPASTGRNFRVFRVTCHNIGGGAPAAYTNSLIANDRICVPAFGNASYDSGAVAAYRAAAPGYDVRAYTHAGWLTDDALHCRAMGIPDRLMLRVAHAPVREETEGPVTISAFVDDRSGAGLTLVELRWRFAGGEWSAAPMNAVSGDVYEGVIPSPPADTTVDYYVVAQDGSGREEGMPRSQPGGWYSFPILRNPATSAPRIASVEAGGTAARPNPFRDATRFSFELRDPDRASLAVHDVAGRIVRRLADGPLAAGRHEIAWDGRDDAGRPVAGGVYYFRLRAAGLVYSRPVVLAR